jgi:hypothetical protein
MSTAEKDDFKAALAAMAAVTPAQILADPTLMNYDDFALIHGQSLQQHGTVWFLSWHRVFLFKFEEQLRKHKPCAVVPYWDWSLDAPSEIGSPVFGASQLGGKLGIGTDFCVDTGSTATIFSPAGTAPFGSASNSHSTPAGMPTCVSRRASVSAFTDMSTLIGMCATASFATFAPNIEGSPHGSVHMYVGGTSLGHMGNIKWSPDDPLFWLHHGFIDAVWAAWQACHGYDNIPVGSITSQMYSGSGPTFGKDKPMQFGTAPWASSETWAYQDVHSIQGLGYSYSYDPFSLSPLFPPICSSGLGAQGGFGYITPSAAAQADCAVCIAESPLFGYCKSSYGGGYCWNPQQGPYSCTPSKWYHPLNSFRRNCAEEYVPPIRILSGISRHLVIQREIELYQELYPVVTSPNVPHYDISLYNCRLLKREAQDYYVQYNDAAYYSNPTGGAANTNPKDYSPLYNYGGSTTPIGTPTYTPTNYGRDLLHRWYDQMAPPMNTEYGAIIDRGHYDPPCGFPYYFRYSNDNCNPSEEVYTTGVTMIGERATLSYGRIKPDCPEANLRPPTLAVAAPLLQMDTSHDGRDLAADPVPVVPVVVSYDDEIPNTSYLRWFGDTHRPSGYPQLSVDVGVHSIMIKGLEGTYFDENDYIYIEGVRPIICPGKDPRAYVADVRVASSLEGMNRRNIRVTEGGLRIFLGIAGRPITRWCSDDYLAVHIEYKY